MTLEDSDNASPKGVEDSSVPAFKQADGPIIDPNPSKVSIYMMYKYLFLLDLLKILELLSLPNNQ